MISKILLYAIHNDLRPWRESGAVVLSWFQRYFCMQYTTSSSSPPAPTPSFYQDFKDTFVCNTQLRSCSRTATMRCFIMISKILLYAIHNLAETITDALQIVLSWFQRYFCMQYTTSSSRSFHVERLFYQDVNEQFCCKSTEKIGYMQIYEKYFVI